MEKKEQSAQTRYRVVRRTINGCPVSIWADTQQPATKNPEVLQYLLAALEDRMKREAVEK
ncbi:hypothetical protein LJC61_03400 [Ruminococcaceae bacterium OttesenSCG-928-A16]|nr:hypothetical protein [Ruminococcaceae bacterium OttesenSCG-928-A16]